MHNHSHAHVRDEGEVLRETRDRYDGLPVGRLFARLANTPLAVWPIPDIAAMQRAMISPSITAYSVVVGPFPECR